MLKRWLSLLLIAGMLLVGCSETGSQTEDETAKDAGQAEVPQAGDDTADVETEYDIFSVLPERDYGDVDFIFFSPTNLDVPVDKGLYSEEMIGVTFEDAVYERNEAVGERYGVKISVFQGGRFDTTYTYLKPNVTAGDNVYDVYLMHCYSRNVEMFQERLAIEWTEIPHIQMDQPWWNQYAIENLRIAGREYYAVSSINVKDVMCLLFNKEMADAYSEQVGDLYSYVDNGTWTMDKLGEVITGMTRDLDGNGIIEEDKDQFGLVYTVSWQLPSMMYACDVTTLTLDDQGYPVMQLDSEQSLNVFEKLFRLCTSPDFHMDPGDFPKVGMDTDRALFVMYNLFRIDRLRDGDVDYGILPLPKYDEQQEHYTNNSWIGPMLVPTTTPAENYDMIGVLMESLSYTGYKDITPLFYDNVLKAKLSRDEESARMLDIITSNDSLIYEAGFTFQFGMHPASFMSGLIKQEKDTYASQIQKQKKVMLAQYTKLYDKVIEDQE